MGSAKPVLPVSALAAILDWLTGACATGCSAHAIETMKTDEMAAP
jgi:hypothetical protein